MRKLMILALLAALAALGGGSLATAQSPLPNRSPVHVNSEPEFRDEADCHAYYQGYYFDPDESDEWTQLAIERCVAKLGQPEPTPEPTVCERPGWWQMAPWMGVYPLWTDGTSFCVEGR